LMLAGTGCGRNLVPCRPSGAVGFAAAGGGRVRRRGRGDDPSRGVAAPGQPQRAAGVASALQFGLLGGLSVALLRRAVVVSPV
jgi:hypothetical protein